MRSPRSPQLEKAHTQQQRPNAVKNRNRGGRKESWENFSFFKERDAKICIVRKLNSRIYEKRPFVLAKPEAFTSKTLGNGFDGRKLEALSGEGD